ncbi:MAG: NAD-dependent epimerase/dehydratase family protein [Planctomycetes bacterium]|nr:NAD-dependent epimerase/dehydratase family protein [Planctomycetota bacterium]
MTRAVFLTGATGFVGGHLAASFAGDGWRVHALARDGADAGVLGALEKLGVRLHRGDLRDARAVAASVARVASDEKLPAIVHCAAVISYRTRDAELQRQVNVDGTRNVLHACRRAPVGRLLHVSSVVAVGYSRAPGELLDEDAAFNGADLGVDYVATKRVAEELVFASGLDAVAVNPGAIFGPGGAGANTLRFLRQVAHGKFTLFAPPGSISPVGVEDVVRGTRLALERGCAGRRYLLVESARPLVECFEIAARELGVPPGRARAPRWLWSAVRAGTGLVDRVRPLDLLTPQAVRMLGLHFVYDASRARRELGWTPEPFERVLARTIAWARVEGRLD